MFVRRARESERLPGLMATAVILLSLGSCKPQTVSDTIFLENLDEKNVGLGKVIGMNTFSKARLSAYIHITIASFEFAYRKKPSPK